MLISFFFLPLLRKSLCVREHLPRYTHHLPLVNNDCLEVDELILEIAHYKNDYADMAAEKLFRKCSTVGKPINICKTVCMKVGYPTAHVSSCDELSKGYKCTCISVENTAMRMNSRERKFL